MADKDNTDPHFSSRPKAKVEYQEQNNLKDLLDDLDAIDLSKNTVKVDEKKQILIEKHKQEPSLPEPFKSPSDYKKVNLENVRDNPGEEYGDEVKKDIKKVHDEAPYTSLTNLVAALDNYDDIISIAWDKVPPGTQPCWGCGNKVLPTEGFRKKSGETACSSNCAAKIDELVKQQDQAQKI